MGTAHGVINDLPLFKVVIGGGGPETQQSRLFWSLVKRLEDFRIFRPLKPGGEGGLTFNGLWPLKNLKVVCRRPLNSCFQNEILDLLSKILKNSCWKKRNVTCITQEKLILQRSFLPIFKVFKPQNFNSGKIDK